MKTEKQRVCAILVKCSLQFWGRISTKIYLLDRWPKQLVLVQNRSRKSEKGPNAVLEHAKAVFNDFSNDSLPRNVFKASFRIETNH